MPAVLHEHGDRLLGVAPPLFGENRDDARHLAAGARAAACVRTNCPSAASRVAMLSRNAARPVSICRRREKRSRTPR